MIYSCLLDKTFMGNATVSSPFKHLVANMY